jgi:hypothetical protein
MDTQRSQLAQRSQLTQPPTMSAEARERVKKGLVLGPSGEWTPYEQTVDGVREWIKQVAWDKKWRKMGE